MYRCMLLVGFLILLSSCGSSSVVNHVIENGALVGAENIKIDGRFYNVEFISSPCIVVFGGCKESADFQFQSKLESKAAADALANQVFVKGVTVGESNYNLDNQLVFRKRGPFYVWIPWGMKGSSPRLSVKYEVLELTESPGSTVWETASMRIDDKPRLGVYAKFEPAQPPE